MSESVQIYFNEFVIQMIGGLQAENFEVPPENLLWHELFYGLHKDQGRRDKPEVISGLQFYEGNKSQDLSEALQSYALVFGVDVINRRFFPNKEYAQHCLDKQSRFSPEIRDYLSYAVKKAKEHLRPGDGK